MLSQSRCTFQILESWPWLQGNPIFTRSAWNFEKPSWPLINVRLTAAKVRFTQSDFRILRALHNLSEGKKRRKTVTLGSRFYKPRAYESCLACQHFISKLLIGHLPGKYNNGKGMLSSVEQAFVGREEIRAPLKTPACEAICTAVMNSFHSFFT